MSVTVDSDKSGMVPQESRRHRFLRGPRPESVPLLVGGACAAVGLIDVAAGVFPGFRHSRMHTLAEVLPGALGPFAAALSLSSGVLLLLLAHGIKRRKRRAWRSVRCTGPCPWPPSSGSRGASNCIGSSRAWRWWCWQWN